jgi:hypothetical protein
MTVHSSKPLKNGFAAAQNLFRLKLDELAKKSIFPINENSSIRRLRTIFQR